MRSPMTPERPGLQRTWSRPGRGSGPTSARMSWSSPPASPAATTWPTKPPMTSGSASPADGADDEGHDRDREEAQVRAQVAEAAGATARRSRRSGRAAAARASGSRRRAALAGAPSAGAHLPGVRQRPNGRVRAKASGGGSSPGSQKASEPPTKPPTRMRSGLAGLVEGGHGVLPAIERAGHALAPRARRWSGGHGRAWAVALACPAGTR